MKHLLCIILTFVISSLSLESQALTFRSAAFASYHEVNAMSSQSVFKLNEHVLYRYYMASYEDPSHIADNRFTPDTNAWMTRTNESSEKGEYQYLGYSYENILLTNDRWFASSGHLGTQFRSDYSGVTWNTVADVQGEPVKAQEKWADLFSRQYDLYDYIVSAPFFDSDHPTKGESPTGFSLSTLLPESRFETRSYLLSAPSKYEDGAVYLQYSQNGTSNYNTIQIPALPRVECVMTAVSDIASIERGKTRDVVVTIDTRDSYALVYHEQMKSEITRRTYWARAGAIADTAPGETTVPGVCRITVPDVSPNTTIHVKASVFSQKVADMGQPAEDMQTASLFIGETIPPESESTGGIAGIVSGTETGTVMDSAANAVLRADLRDGERFDVTKGVPSTETMYAQVGGREYLVRQTFHEVTGTITYMVIVRHPVQPAEPDPVLPGQVQSEVPPPSYATTSVRVSRDYSYWEISALEVYALESASLRNVALPGGFLILYPSVLPILQSVPRTSELSSGQPLQQPASAYSAPTVDFIHQVDDLLTYHLQIGSTSRSVNASSWDDASIRNIAQSAVPAIMVRNDRLIINGKTVLSGAVASGSGARPIPAEPGFLSREALFMPGLAIPAAVVNGTYPTTGTITYSRLPDSVINGGILTSVIQSIPGVNPVVVHTPVVLSADLVSDDAHNQDPRADSGVGSIVLGRPFVILLSNSGSHLGMPGYGSRDYSEYVSDREVRLSFDAYSGSLYTGRLLKSGVWHSFASLGIPISENQLELKVPSWVQPGSHLVEIRTCSINDAFSGSRVAVSTAVMTASRQPVAGTPQLTGRLESGFGANLRLEAHAVSISFPVNVVGRIYDFLMTDVEDPMWETFFRIAKGNAASTGKRFTAGTRNINGDADTSRTSILPVMPGKNTQSGFQDRAVKLGYGIRFEVKTIGDFHDENDIIRIHPTFAYVDKNGKNRVEVDLYYSVPGRPLVKVGSPEDSAIWPGKMNLLYRGLSETEWTETGKTLWQLKGGAAGYASDSAYASAFLKDAQKGIDMFRTWRIQMGEPVRTFRGPVPSAALPANMEDHAAFASMQKWYGEYRLPPDTLIVPKGTDLSHLSHITAQDSVFLKEGYLLVNFRAMEVIGNGDYAHPSLQYSGRDLDAASVDKPSVLNGADPFITDMGNGWFLEGYQSSQTIQAFMEGKLAKLSRADQTTQTSWDLREGDAIAFYANRRSTDDIMGLGTH